MRAGRLRHQLTFYERYGHPPAWKNIGTTWGALEPPKNASLSGTSDIGTIGLRRLMPITAITRCSPDIRPGLLMSHAKNFYSVDAVANQDEKGVNNIITLRQFAGAKGIYTRKSDGRNFDVICGIEHVNEEAIYPTRRQTMQVMIEVLLFHLIWPWGQRGDIIKVNGVKHLLDETPPREYDGYSIAFKAIPNPPDNPLV